MVVIKGRAWCGTLNNYTPDDIDEAYAMQMSGDFRYGVIGKEVGEAGTEHLQVFLYLSNAVRMSHMTSFFSGRAHWELKRGTVDEAADYCMKEGDYFEFGNRPMSQDGKGQAECTDYRDAIQYAKRGEFDLIRADLFTRFKRTYECIHREEVERSSTDLDGDLCHEWWYGPPGTGKTSKAYRDYPGCFRKDPKERWWDGYSGQETVVIDDFDKYQISQSGDMKRWIDRYVFQAPVKGGYICIRPKRVIVTSNYHPDEIWEDDVTRSALRRRVRITHFPATIF